MPAHAVPFRDRIIFSDILEPIGQEKRADADRQFIKKWPSSSLRPDRRLQMVDRLKKIYEYVTQRYATNRAKIKYVLPIFAFAAALLGCVVNSQKMYAMFFGKLAKLADPVLQVESDHGIIPSFEDRWADLKPMDASLMMQLLEIARVQALDPNAKVVFPDVKPWDFGFGVDYYGQGDDDGVLRTEWHSCLTPGPKRAICGKTPEYRRKHHLHSKDWRG